jgi:hypothetical protein
MRVRVLTLNIWNDQGDPRHLDLINRELCRLAPDLVAFQEVKHTPEHSQLDTLLAGTDLHGTHQTEGNRPGVIVRRRQADLGGRGAPREARGVATKALVRPG